ncbi:hypothetical protein VPH35_137492 [Triticum aestivum]
MARPSPGEQLLPWCSYGSYLSTAVMLVTLSASAGSWTRALSIAVAARCFGRHGQAAPGHGDGGEFVLEPRGFAGTDIFLLDPPFCFATTPLFFATSSFVFLNIFVFCWNWCPCLLQLAGVCATRSVPRRGSYIEQQGVLYPTPFEHRELQSCMPELQPAAGGAAREGGNFLLMHFLLNQFFVFAGTGVFFCWNQDNFLLHRLQSSQMLMSFLLAPKFVFARSIFDFASTDHRTSTWGEVFCWKIFVASRFFAAWHSNPASWRRRDDVASHPDC